MKDPLLSIRYHNLRKSLREQLHRDDVCVLHHWTQQVLPTRRQMTVSDDGDGGRSDIATSRRTVSESESHSDTKAPNYTGDKIQNYKKGLLIPLRKDQMIDNKHEINEVLQKFEFDYSELRFESNGWIMTSQHGQDEYINFDLPSPPPESMSHPAFTRSTCNHVFHSLDEVLACLQMVRPVNVLTHPQSPSHSQQVQQLTVIDFSVACCRRIKRIKMFRLCCRLHKAAGQSQAILVPELNH